MQPICGIDEAGRGCIAGSLVIVGVVLNRAIDGLMDSKKLTESKREKLYPLIIENSKYHIVSFSSEDIDKKGLSNCMKEALKEIKEVFYGYHIIFDGNTSFGVENIKAIVKADESVAEVSASSILAKVTRDREIIKNSIIYPQYGFDKHKGYGTKAHIEAIKKYGYCPLHRKSYKIKSLEF